MGECKLVDGLYDLRIIWMDPDSSVVFTANIHDRRYIRRMKVCHERMSSNILLWVFEVSVISR